MGECVCVTHPHAHTDIWNIILGEFVPKFSRRLCFLWFSIQIVTQIFLICPLNSTFNSYCSLSSYWGFQNSLRGIGTRSQIICSKKISKYFPQTKISPRIWIFGRISILGSFFAVSAIFHEFSHFWMFGISYVSNMFAGTILLWQQIYG